MEKDAMDAVHKAKQQLASNGKKPARTPVFAKGVLPMLAILAVGFLAMGAAIIYEGKQAERHYWAEQPPIPTTYHAFVPEDPVIGPVLANPDLRTDAPRARPKHDLLVPVGYGGDVPISSSPCTVSPDGYLVGLGVYDERSDGNVEGVIAVYMAPPNSVVEPGECSSKLVFMIEPEYQLFG